jgi:hypothetical protein
MFFFQTTTQHSYSDPSIGTTQSKVQIFYKHVLGIIT